MRLREIVWFMAVSLCMTMTLGACLDQPTQAPAAHPPLVILNWNDYISPAVIQAFSDEFNAEVTIVTYESTDAATALIDSGQPFDLAILDQEYVAPLIAQGKLAKIDYHLIPNARNLAPDFRNLVHDPGNVYSIPHTWGTSGLIVRPDLVTRPITRWEDLWDPSLAGKILLRAEPSDVLGMCLLTLGLPLWTDDPAQMEQAVQKLLQLKGRVIFDRDSVMETADALVRGDVAIMSGWSSDARYVREQNVRVDYVIPEEGSLFWLDRIVIFANSPQQEMAHRFVDFVLRPEVSAAFTNEYYDATANEAAWAYVDEEIAGDPSVFPSREDFARAVWYPPFEPQTSQFYEQTWQRVLLLMGDSAPTSAP